MGSFAAQPLGVPRTKVAGVCWVDDAGAVEYLNGSGMPVLSTYSLPCECITSLTFNCSIMSDHYRAAPLQKSTFPSFRFPPFNRSREPHLSHKLHPHCFAHHTQRADRSPPPAVAAAITHDMDCLARRARFFEQPIHQSVAESCAPGSFCGDVTHLRPVRVSDRSAEKSLQLFKIDASSSIIHDLEFPWSIIPEPKLAAPLILPPSQWSRKMLKVCVDSEEAEYAKGVARVMEECKVCRRYYPRCPGSNRLMTYTGCCSGDRRPAG